MSALHVEHTGEGRDLVLLHGWGLHSGVWAEVVAPLSKRFRIHAIDLPGHGHSAAILAPTFEDAVELVSECVPEGAHVCGWSLGALVAQRLARARGPRLDRLVLVGATPCFAERAGWDAAMKRSTLGDFASGLAVDREATLARFVRLNALNGSRGREAIRALTATLGEREPPPPSALEATLAWLGGVDLRGEAATIAQPTLVVHGTRDQLAPVEAGRWLAATLPNARLLEIEDAAHLPFFTHRDEFVAAVERHLGEGGPIG